MKTNSLFRTAIVVLACNFGLVGCCQLLQADAPVEQYSEKNKEMNAIYHFAFDEAALSEKDKPALDAFVAYLLEHPEVKAHVDGYTDVQGPRAYNLNLGMERAQAVASYLQAQGISEDRIVISSYGADKEKLVDASYTREAHAKNRRAVIYVTQERDVA
jgi:outer membrane protein OmpA-like peptidoglycan-associated protein